MTSSVDLSVDILIIGAGPAGLYAAYYAGFRGLRVAVLDALDEPGGQISAMYPEKAILDIAGFPSVKGRDLIDGLLAQAAPYSPEYVLGERASNLRHLPDGSVAISTDKDRTIFAGAVVICGGIGAFTPRPLPKGHGFLGRGLSYFVPDLSAHADRDVVIVGGGDSAFDWAAHLEPIAKSVTLVHRRDKFRAHKASVAKVFDSSVQVVVNADVSAVRGEEWISEVDIAHKAGHQDTLSAQSVIAALGFTADLGPLNDWGIAIENRHVLVDTRMQTTAPRVYAAGDITDYPGKVRLIAVGFGEAATAVNNAAAVLDPDAEIFPGHSTEQEN
ncbi:NAD(P)/FAD-dependent oxidoreductase [Rhodococcus sp. BP-252]|uniref:Ferredoxin--NADP reductase n=1 Tax=Rhodococcoides kyotonense TaxID=398843 RepID=A0A177Y8T2_9NOCA|nr:MULTISPECIES: NAD(P)/FAD-dependent oxidoreductase [Rhodococcus]MBY6411853.1 NAD(P)/FAD-dependent oxidoreductase [Rhodococcus sp. BP-320]MBY6416519.1 NAD(P)/FAD-dependent oxidoreductase [Rhodococcus sp. BP-321]MBY6420675.1 NAD(P)/FAD-dependent oxidoreductase [Rhodococcus sp. BP-324]MBY6426543.1 NAD(P)/FAD-dependent oxidoreductase [Rhodococcus sp. BP-323]MBY6431542.1 NAD(P)/FAD-dependent oxidoreductase [Rhodococcus sp. BP-322]